MVIELANGTKEKFATYEYGLDKVLPRDFQNVLGTPPLLKKAMAFLCSLLRHHVKRPPTTDQVTVVISGYRRGQDALKTLKRVFCDDAEVSRVVAEVRVHLRRGRVERVVGGRREV